MSFLSSSDLSFMEELSSSSSLSSRLRSPPLERDRPPGSPRREVSSEDTEQAEGRPAEERYTQESHGAGAWRTKCSAQCRVASCPPRARLTIEAFGLRARLARGGAVLAVQQAATRGQSRRVLVVAS